MRKSAVVLALLLSLGTAPALAQSPLEQVYDSLKLLQDANLGIARQMAELEQQAATELELQLQQGKIGNPASQAIARTFVGNARTLAAIMLSPMQTYQTAAGESMFVLVRRNIELLRGITSYRAADPALDAAITRYTVLQMQTQDMAEALQHGWTRYGEILKTAEASGLIASNTFDPDTQSWALGNPVVGGLPAPALTGTPVAALAPTPAAPDAPAEPVTPELGDLASTVTPLVVLEIEPAAPTTTTEVANLPEEPTAPVAEPEPAAPADTEERLTPNGPLDVAEPEPQPEPPREPVTVKLGDWSVTTNAEGETVATSGNLLGDTRETISVLSMACAPDSSVAYAIVGAKQFPAFRVFSDRSANVTVDASSNVVLGPDAVAMADALASATAWAQLVPDSGRNLTIRTADAEGVLAMFSPNGYLDARSAVMSACADGGGLPVAAIEPLVPQTPVDQPEQEVVVPEPEAPAETAGREPEPAATAEVKAPVPAPRLDRTRIELQQPQPTTPAAPAKSTPRPPAQNNGPVPLM